MTSKMTPEMWNRVSQAFDQAEELDPESRRKFLDKLRQQHPDVWAIVENLLQEDSNVTDLLGESSSAARRGFERINQPRAQSSRGEVIAKEWPELIGFYKIEKEIARGGMGIVLQAQDLKLHRRVAVKVIMPEHHDNEDFIRRFEEEALLTARLSHPGIPPVFDVGKLEDGRAYLVMKLIKGKTFAAKLRADSDSKKNFSELLADFEQVCLTVAYAHSRGIIHRDLKPGNIMVGAFGEVQVMDWGLAKPVAEPCLPIPQGDTGTNMVPPRTLSENTLTVVGAVMGTRVYMAPEQARGEIDNLDERCDVFALGAILCTMLTGEPPYRVTPVEIEEELMESDEKLAGTLSRESVKAQILVRKTEKGDVADAFVRLSRCRREDTTLNDLVTLAKRCLAPDKQERPAHAGEVAAAIANYQAERQKRERQAQFAKVQAELRAVEERKRRKVEQAKAWEERRRRRTQLTLGVVVVVALSACIICVSWMLVQVNSARHEAAEAQIAEAKRAEGEKQAKEKAQLRLRQMEKINDVLASILRDLDPKEVAATLKPLQAILGKRFDLAVAQLEGEVKDPLMKAKMQNTLGLSVLNLGYPKKAITLFTKSRNGFIAHLDPQEREIFDTTNHLIACYWEVGELEQAQSLLEESLRVYKAKLGPAHDYTRITTKNLIQTHAERGKKAPAEALIQERLKWARKHYSDDIPELAKELGEACRVLLKLRSYSEAESLCRKCLALHKNQPADNGVSFHIQSMLGEALLGQKKYAEAEPLLTQSYWGLKKNEPQIRSQILEAQLREALERLVRLYEITGKREDTNLSGHLSVNQPKDVQKVKLSARTVAVIEMDSLEFRVCLALEDTQGHKLVEDCGIDTKTKKRGPRLVFSPEQDGVYYIVVTALQPLVSERYRITLHQLSAK